MVWDTSTRTAVFDDQFTLKVPHDHRLVFLHFSAIYEPLQQFCKILRLK